MVDFAGNITETTVYVDEDNVMTVESLVTKMYPNVNELFQEIKVVKVVSESYVGKFIAFIGGLNSVIQL